MKDGEETGIKTGGRTVRAPWGLQLQRGCPEGDLLRNHDSKKEEENQRKERRREIPIVTFQSNRLNVGLMRSRFSSGCARLTHLERLCCRPAGTVGVKVSFSIRSCTCLSVKRLQVRFERWWSSAAGRHQRKRPPSRESEAFLLALA